MDPKSPTLRTLAMAAALAAAPAWASGGTVAVANPGFESPTLSAGSPATSGTAAGWTGSFVNTVLASSYGLSATEGAQVAYSDSPVGNNGLIAQTTPGAMQANTVYTLHCDVRPTVNDAANNAAAVTLSDSGFTVNMAEATYRSSALAPGGYSSPDEFTLTYGQWTRVVLSFNSADFPSQVAANRQIVILIKGHRLAVDNVRLYSAANDYYVSKSGGNDAFDGLTPATAWQNFENLRTRTLSPGDRVLLKRGDQWTSSNLELRGKGTVANRILLSAYGTGPNPVVTGINRDDAACITVQNPSYFDIDSMDGRFAKVGLYLRYKGDTFSAGGVGHNNHSVTVRSCNFEDMNKVWSDGSGAISVVAPYELSWGAGIWLGGSVLGGPPDDALGVLDGLTVEYCSFQRCSMGVGWNWYFPAKNYTRITNVVLRDCWATGCEAGGFSLFHTTGADVRRFDTYSGGSGFYNTGTTNGFFETVKDATVDDCDFGFGKRNSTAHDGVGFDFEGDTSNAAFTNNVIHDNDGAGMLILATSGGVANTHIQDNTFYNNLRNPLDAVENREFRNDTSSNGGSIRGNGVYLGAANAFGAPALQTTPVSRLANFTSGSAAGNLSLNGNRTGTAYASVSGRPTAWDFTGGPEGWGNFSADWGSPAAASGLLTGTSTGIDPYAEGPATWANARLNQMVRVRMSVTSGGFGQLFFQTETDPTWTGPKSVAFPLLADGVMREYLLDMRSCAAFKGVVTKLRLDPTDTAGASIQVDKVEIRTDPIVRSLSPVSSRIVDVFFNEMMLPAGGVLNPANYAASGAGVGTLSAQPDTVTPVSTPAGTAYRLGWNAGAAANGSAITVTVANARDALGTAAFPMASGSAVAVPVGIAGFAAE